jgi:putative membrane protein
MPQPVLAYCGSPPVPGATSWNLDPVLVACLTAIALAYAWSRRSTGAPSRSERACFAAGWVIVAAALISPLCNLSVALFYARVGQHMLLALVAAPLVALGRPGHTVGLSLRGWSGRRSAQLFLSTGLFAIALWVWHAPGPYNLTFRSDLAYWAMHLTTFGAAVWLWSALLDGFRSGGASLAAGFATMMQMSLLGALITFAPAPLFAVHAETTAAWGLTQLEDQQLGGLIMWVPAGALFTLYLLAGFGAWLSRLEQRSAASGPASSSST